MGFVIHFFLLLILGASVMLAPRRRENSVIFGAVYHVRGSTHTRSRLEGEEEMSRRPLASSKRSFQLSWFQFANFGDTKISSPYQRALKSPFFSSFSSSLFLMP